MATVSGIAPANGAFPLFAIGVGAGARAPTIRDTTGLAAAAAGQVSNTNANPNALPQSSAFAARDTGIDGQNGVRLAGDNGALLDLSTSLIAQEAAQGDETGGEEPFGGATGRAAAAGEEEEAADPDGLATKRKRWSPN